MNKLNMQKYRQENRQVENIRHSLAHLLAMAVLKKYPMAKLGIGPVIENGFYYDFLLPEVMTAEMLPELEKEMKRTATEGLLFSGKKVTPLEAKKLFKNQPFKLELARDFVKEKKQLTIYTTGHKISRPTTYNLQPISFTDLCRGGHVKNTQEINPDVFALTHLAGAYWKGSEKNPMLTRIYGVAFATKKELDQWREREQEAKKRDHRVLGEQLGIFTLAKEVGPGLPLWLPNGTMIRDLIEEYAKKIERAWGYERVATPHIAKEELYRMSGHIPYYANDMFPPMALDDGNYYLKAMNCPHTHMIYKARPKSYRDLPVRYAEYGTVYRYERSGTLAGMLRVRGFTQNDAHIYCREDQAEDEFLNVMRLHEFWYRDIFGITDFYMRLSLPTKDNKKYANLPKEWAASVRIVRSAMKKSGLPFVEAEGEAAFYGPKVDFQIKSVIGREESASTNQLDFLATKRFNLTYKGNDGKDKPVFVIHRAPLGSHERFIAFLIEHYAGAFPFWLAPVQIAVLPIGEKQRAYAKKVFDELFNNGFRVQIRDADESLGKRIREAELQKIPYLLIVGEKEENAETVSVRQHGKGDLGAMPMKKFLTRAEIENAPPRK